MTGTVTAGTFVERYALSLSWSILARTSPYPPEELMVKVNRKKARDARGSRWMDLGDGRVCKLSGSG